jgi:hypothetical protein
MMRRIFKYAVLVAVIASLGRLPSAGEGEKTEEAPARKTFVRPRVPEALFTPEKIALLQPECERIAVYLARRAAEKYTEGVLRGDAAAMTGGRLLLTVSLHLQPLNGSAVLCASRWMDGKAPSLPPPSEDPRGFSNFLLSAARRQAGNAGPAREALGRILTFLAADLDPANEDAIYECEIQDRDHKAAPLKELLEGTLGRGWPEPSRK